MAQTAQKNEILHSLNHFLNLRNFGFFKQNQADFTRAPSFENKLKLCKILVYLYNWLLMIQKVINFFKWSPRTSVGLAPPYLKFVILLFLFCEFVKYIFFGFTILLRSFTFEIFMMSVSNIFSNFNFLFWWSINYRCVFF